MAANPRSSTTAFSGIIKESKGVVLVPGGNSNLPSWPDFHWFQGLLGDGTYACVCVCYILKSESPISPIK